MPDTESSESSQPRNWLLPSLLTLKRHYTRYATKWTATVLRGFVLLFLLKAVGFNEAIKKVLPDQTVNSILIAVLLVAGADILRSTDKIRRSLTHRPRQISILPHQGAHEKEVLEYVRNNEIKTATLFHFSGHHCQSLVHQLVRKGAEVNLYMSDPGSMAEVSLYQEQRINQSLNAYRDFIKTTPRAQVKGALKIYLCSSWPVMSATILDRSLICVSWYVIHRPSAPDGGNQVYIVSSPEIFFRASDPGFDCMYDYLTKEYISHLCVTSFSLGDNLAATSVPSVREPA